MPQNNLSLAHPKSDKTLPVLTNYTMCPNWLYDTVLVSESASVAKVVLYINRNTTGRSQAGHRAETVQASYGVIAREMNMSVRAVGDAVRTALAKGYLIQVKAGRAATSTMVGEGSWYALNWQWPMIPSSIYVNLEIPPVLVSNKADKPSQEQVETFVERVERQKLPGQLWQKLPADINKAESESNKKIELMTNNQKLPNRPDSFSSTFDSPNLKPKRRGSRVIGRLITDFTRELGDTTSLTLPNIGRALNLWNKSSLAEADFVALLYEARKRVLGQTSPIQHKRLDSHGATSDYPNRIPYFFRVVENMLADASMEHSTQTESAYNQESSGIWQDLCRAKTDAHTEGDGCVEINVPTGDMAGLQTNVEPTEVGTDVGADRIRPQVLLGVSTLGTWSIKRMNAEELVLADRPASNKFSEEVKKWAVSWSNNAELVIEKWQTLLNRLPVTLRQLFEAKTLIISTDLANHPLLAATGLSTATNKQVEAVQDLILICRNPFELRYLSRYLPDLTIAVGSILGYEVQVWPISL